MNAPDVPSAMNYRFAAAVAFAAALPLAGCKKKSLSEHDTNELTMAMLALCACTDSACQAEASKQYQSRHDPLMPLDQYNEGAQGVVRAFDEKVHECAAPAYVGQASSVVPPPAAALSAAAGSAAAAASDGRSDLTLWKVPAVGPTRGGADALVTIIELGDFEDPFTARIEETLARLSAANKGDLRIVWKNTPLSFHKRATAAAELALEARAEKGDGGFWDAHDRLLGAHQKLEDADLDAIAKAVHLDATAAHTAVQTNKYAPDIQKDADLASKLAVTGTPAFFVNGRHIAGANAAALEAAIAKELSAARALVSSGTARAGIYDAVTKGGVEAAKAP